MRKLVTLLVGLLLISVHSFSQCSVSLGGNLSICRGQTVIIRTNIIGGTPTTFTWTSTPAGIYPGDDSLIVSPISTITYVVHASGSGCNTTDTIVVTVKALPTAPPITFSPNNVCSGSPVNFSTPSQGPTVTFSWNFGDGTTATGNVTSHKFTSYGSGTGVFNVTCTAISNNGCTNSIVQQVNVVQKPHAQLGSGSGVDTLNFNGYVTFYKCTNGAQQITNFNFINTTSTTTNITYTILWGDTSAPYTPAAGWTNVSHVYGRGIYTLDMIVANTGNGCADTVHYKVFFGSNAAIGMATLGSTNICGPDSMIFLINNYQNNTPGTVYTVTFNDSSAPLVFSHPPPDTFFHYFSRSSCGISSTNGVTTFNNSFSANIVVTNPCGLTAASVLPIYISFPPIANFTVTNHDTVCVNTTATVQNTSIGGQIVSNNGCSSNYPLLWSITPNTGWNLVSGSFGSDNGFTGVNFDPTSWTSGSQNLGVNFTTIGYYTVQLVAANDCGADTTTRIVCVSGPPVPSFTLLPTVGCTRLVVTTSNTTPAVNGCSTPHYLWAIVQNSFTCNPDSLLDFVYSGGTNSTSASPQITFNNQGIYSITMSGINTCGTVTTAPQLVTVKRKPLTTISAPPNICNAGSISPTSTALPCAGTISTYAWTFAGGTPATSSNAIPGSVSFSTSGAHTISLAVTNECGTTNINTSVLVDTLPTAIAGNDQSICTGGITNLGSAPVVGYTYVWTPATGLSAINIANPTVTLTNNTSTPVSQTYILTVSNASGCSSNDTVIVTVYPLATLNAGLSTSVCSGQTVSLYGTFGGATTSVTWTSDNGGSFSNNTDTLSTYTPTILNGNVILTLTTNNPAGPCGAVNDSLVVTVIPPPVAVAGIDDSVCSGNPIQIGGGSQIGYTYAWSPVTGLSSSTISNPTVTLTNNGNSVITQTYILVATAGGCTDNDTVTISVFAPPTANAGAIQTMCAGDTVTLTGTISGTASSATWSSANGTFINPNSLTTQFIPNIPSGTATATLTTNTPGGPCVAASSNVSITVNGIPSITNNPLSQTSCSASATQNIILTSNIVGTSFSWSGSSANGITGFTASGNTSNIPSMVLTNPNNTAGTVVYVIIPTANNCPGLPVNYTITVNPLPNVNPVAIQTVCSGVSTTAVNPSSNFVGTTFSWLATAGVNISGFTASGNGNIPVQTILNSGTTLDSVVFTITPALNGCNGATTKFIVRVNPLPNVNLPPAQTICSGTSTTIATLTSNVAGTTFAWSATASNGNISGFTLNGNGNIPAQTITNVGIISGSVTYAITPTANNCPGILQNYIVTVNPIPLMSATPPADTICTGVQANIALSSTVAGTAFAWTATGSASVSGFSNGSGTTILQTLTNSSQNLQTVTYTLTPTANSCPGANDTVTITVNPSITIQFSELPQTICSGQTTLPVAITSPSAGVVFAWTSSGAGLSGVTASGTDSIPAQTLIDNTTGIAIATYTVSATYAGCSSQTATYDITVKPTPSVILPPMQTICSGTPAAGISLNSNVGGTTFTWSGSSPNGVTGFIPNGNTLTIPAQVLTNASTAPAIVVYVIIPTNNGCPGTAVNDTITVNPLPVINPLTSQTICSNSASTLVNLSSATAGTTFSWVANAGVNLSGFTANGSGDIPVQTILNSGNTVDSVVFTITPTANDCPGPNRNYSIVVNPTPNVILPPAQTICSGATTAVVNLASNVTGTSFVWTANATANISGFTTNGNGNIPAQIISNSGVIAGSVTYTVTPTANTCPGNTGNYVININPNPAASSTPPLDTICTNTQTNFSLSSNVANTSYVWTANAPATVTGSSNGNGNLIQQTLSNSSQTQQTVVYTVIPTANSCPGQLLLINAVVNPGVTILFSTLPQTICSGQTTTQVDITSPTTGVAFTWSSNANGILGVTANGTNTIPAQTLTSNFNVSTTVSYFVNSTFNGCSGQVDTFDILVNPTPLVVVPVDQTICSQGTSNAVALISNVANATFSWSGSTVNGITGFTPNGNTSSIPPQTLLNPNFTAGTVVYAITATANNCSGPGSNHTITVNPLPDVILPATQTFCNGTSLNAVPLSSNVANTSYTWVATSTTITGFTANGIGDIPSQTLSNATNFQDSVRYTITPTANNCPGPVVNYFIVVNPTPALSFAPAPQTICSGETTQQVNITSATPNVTINWTANVPTGISGATASGSNIIPPQTLTDSNLLSIIYTAQANTSGTVCAGTPAQYLITMKPIPEVNFTQSQTNGCSPLFVDFLPSSNNFGIPDSLVFNWGDGSPNSVTYPNPIVPYWNSLHHAFYNTTPAPVTFTVSMRAINQCIDTTITRTVSLLPNLINSFFTATPASGCEPLTVTFQDQSTGAAALSWCWDFNMANNTCTGGGAVDTPGATILHTFSAGSHVLALYINNGFGCSHDTAFQTINVSAAPVADFSSGNNLCAESTVQFTQLSSAPAGSFLSQYDWQFGDGDISVLVAPSHIYALGGTYNACLKVTSTFGCTDTVCEPLTILEKPVADFNFLDICVNTPPIKFTNLSTAATPLFYDWNFGDGNSSSLQNPANNYLNEGSYTVTLIASTTTCRDTVSHTVVVYPIPNAAFTMPNYNCGVPSTISFNNNSGGAIGYSWDFGDGNSSTATTPSTVYNAAGTYNVTLSVSNQFGCIDTATSDITIYPFPKITSVDVIPAKGCQPLDVAFSVHATTAKNFVWNFGDGTTFNSTLPVANHTYPDTGTYPVLLQVYSFNDCGDTILLFDTIHVHIHPTAAFSYTMDANVEPYNGTVLFYNESLNAATYIWSFGDDSTSVEINPAHLYQEINHFDVMLVAISDFGCTDTTVKTLEVVKKTLFVPNAFAPDFSGGNKTVNVWLPAGTGLQTYHAQIFNTWGELLWESYLLTADHKPAEGWDGSYNGKLCQQDVYVWKIDATFMDGTRWKGMSYKNSIERKTIGDVTLIR